MRALTEAIVRSPADDGDPEGPAVADATQDLPDAEAEAVGHAAAAIWESTVGRGLQGAARDLAAHLAADPAFDPLPWGAGIAAFVDQRLRGRSPNLIQATQGWLYRHAHDSGLIQQVEAEIERVARVGYAAMTPLERGVYGFTTRNPKRVQLAEPHLANVPDSRRRFVAYQMSRLEAEQAGAQREARYATAIRPLAARGETRAAISRTLGISTSVMDRIERENRADVPLRADDPILTDLAPSIAPTEPG